MQILYVAMKYDYGKPERGYSFEHYNFHHSLLSMGFDVLYFDFMTFLQKYGRDRMNRRLAEVCRTEKPDLLFCVLFTHELDPKIIRQISEGGHTVTLNWFCDDHWRFDDFSRHWAPCFNWVVTTAAGALSKYADLGYRNVIKSQWACNHYLYRPLELPLIYDATFVRQPHGNRRSVIEALRKAGIDVQVWGTGWEKGRLSQEEMIRVFNQSRINLNLSNASVPRLPQVRLKETARRWLSRALNGISLESRLKTKIQNRFISSIASYVDQIKGRNFEIPGCGAFVLSGWAEELDRYYGIGDEVACFDDPDDLIEKIRYYLKHEEERSAIARAGYRRTLRDHTYVRRFTEVFRAMGLPGGVLHVTSDGSGLPDGGKRETDMETE